MDELCLLPWPRRLLRSAGSCSLERGWRASASAELSGDVAIRSLLNELQEMSPGRSPSQVPMSIVSQGAPGHCRLCITPQRIQLEYGDRYGLHHAKRILQQLLDHARDGQLPCLDIEDWPAWSWRGLHLDVSRHFFPAKVVCEVLDLMAYHGLNVFHWHLCDDQGWRLEIPDLPRLHEVAAWRDTDGSRYGGWYTEDDVRQVVTHAQQVGIAVVPEIELPGHCRAALAAYPRLCCSRTPGPVPGDWGVFEDVYCAGSDEVFRFLEQVFAHVLKLFPGPWVHIGGDEVPRTRWEKCPRCQRRMRDEGLRDTDQLQAWFVARAAQMLQRAGKRVIGWDEVLDGGLDSSVAVMSWRGEQGGLAAAQAGHKVVMSPGSHCYFDHAQAESGEPPAFPAVLPLERVFQFAPLPEGLEEVYHANVLGGQANCWTERITTREHLHYMLLPRLCAIAEALWWPTEGRPDYADFLQRLAAHSTVLDRYGFKGRSLR